MTEVSVNTIAAIGVCQCFPACGKGVFIFYRNSRTLFPSCLDPTRHSSNVFSRPASQAQRGKSSVSLALSEPATRSHL